MRAGVPKLKRLIDTPQDDMHRSGAGNDGGGAGRQAPSRLLGATDKDFSVPVFKSLEELFLGLHRRAAMRVRQVGAEQLVERDTSAFCIAANRSLSAFSTAAPSAAGGPVFVCAKVTVKDATTSTMPIQLVLFTRSSRMAIRVADRMSRALFHPRHRILPAGQVRDPPMARRAPSGPPRSRPRRPRESPQTGRARRGHEQILPAADLIHDR